jgi:hypothetical protein
MGVLRKYVAAFYDRQRRLWEQGHLRLLPLKQDDPNLTFGDPQQPHYLLRVQRDLVEWVRELVQQADELYQQDVANFPHIHFDRHLYQPLLVSDPHERMEATPPGLNQGEERFVRDLRDYLQKNSAKFEGQEIFLLRNLTRGRGLGFFEAGDGEAFYPDFILWVIAEGQQWIAFIDPHGLRHARWDWREDPKVQLHKDLKAQEPELQKHCQTWEVHLTSFIVSTTPFEEVGKLSGSTKEEFAQEHVFFQEDADYIQKIVG